MHYGVKGMKWGVRKASKQTGYRSTSIKSAIARKSNEKVDESFKNWGENAKKRDNAIDLGKKANAAKLAYEKDKSNSELKSAYKSANKEYKKALSKNTTYRKGVVRQEVGRDASRKYLSEAKKVKKQLDIDPSNKELKKKYNNLMSKHDIERANARRAVEVGSKRSNRKAAIKRKITLTTNAAIGAAATVGAAYVANRYFNANISAQSVSKAARFVKRGIDFMGYVY